MKKIGLHILFVLFIVNSFSQSMNDFPLWLQAVWEIKSETGSSYEEWVKLDEGLLRGRTYRIFNNDTVVFDTMKIKIVDSYIIYEMSASIKNTLVYAGYPLQKPDPSLWKFENTQIDYPLNINYMRLGSDTIYVWTEAKDANTACMDYLLVKFSNE